MRRWVVDVLIGLDQWANAVLGGAPDETISARAGRARVAGQLWGRALCAFLDWLDPGHCEDAVVSERTGAHLPPDYQQGGT